MQTENKPVRANAKMRSHGFSIIHTAAIRTRRVTKTSHHPMELEVTGIWHAPGDPHAKPILRSKGVALGTRQPLERFARVNKLPLQPFTT